MNKVIFLSFSGPTQETALAASNTAPAATTNTLPITPHPPKQQQGSATPPQNNNNNNNKVARRFGEKMLLNEMGR